MSTLPKNIDIKEHPESSIPYTWSVKDDVKNAVIAYKAYINNGTTSQQFEKAVNNLLCDHFKKNRAPFSVEKVEITEEDLKNLGMTYQEFSICMQTLSNVLVGVKVQTKRAEEGSFEYVFLLTLTLL